MQINTKQVLLVLFGIAVIIMLPIALIRQEIKKITHIESKKIAKIERKLARKQGATYQSLELLKNNVSLAMESLNRNFLILPTRLLEVPSADQEGIVIKVTPLPIDGVAAPYNASIIEGEKEDYHLFFRVDVPTDVWNRQKFHSYIGYANLDSNFSVFEIIPKIGTKSHFSEDPRIVKVGSNYYLSYNDKLPTEVYCRTIHVGKWDPHKKTLSHITNLDQQISPIEKNWVPFAYQEKDKPCLQFVYQINPHKIMRLDDPNINAMTHLTYNHNPSLLELHWESKWGKIRGGSTARLIGNEYLSFFHSSFTENNLVWYVMGAYTFESKPPFRITGMSKYPILFKGLYDTQHQNTANPKLRCIFPAGFAIEKTEKSILLHVSCGENDSGIKIVSMDYQKLRKSMANILVFYEH